MTDTRCRPTFPLLLLLLAATPLAAQQPAALERVQLLPDVYLFRAPERLDYWTSSNTVVIVNDSDVTVFDSNARPAVSRMVIAEIRRLTSKPVRTLINSHWHMDHWMGNGEYARAFPGLQIISSIQTREYLARMSNDWFANLVNVPRYQALLDTAEAEARRSGTPLAVDRRRSLTENLRQASELAADVRGSVRALPNMVFGDSLVFWRGGREFRLLTADGDATGSTVLFLPAERLLATGDVLVRQESGEGAQPWTLNSYAVRAWLTSLRRLDALDAAIIVPGQGPAMRDESYLQLTVALFDAIIAQVNGALARGLARLEDVQAAVDLSAIRAQFTRNDASQNAMFDAVAAGSARRTRKRTTG